MSDTDAARAADYIRLKRYAAWTFIVASPILIALPPRKLDLHTIALTGAFLISTNHLMRVYTGQSLTETIEARFHRSPGILHDLPSERARDIQAKLKAARDAQSRDALGHVTEELQRVKQQQERGLAERVWMGRETAGWKKQRLREEQKALEEGKGYGYLIMNHIWEVVNWGKTDSARNSSTDTNNSKR
jgi:hypothetical protein